MKKYLCATAVALLAVSAAPARAIVLTQWTFEVNTPPDRANSQVAPSADADFGNGIASGFHASAGTDWTTPAGNGSANAFSSNEWSTGDYYQFQISTSGFEDIVVKWDQTRSSTGPASFGFAYSIDGATFADVLPNYTVTESWATITRDLSAISTVENNSSVFFRIVSRAAGTTTAGTSRLDNFTVEGTAIAPVTGVPEPSTALFGVALAAVTGCFRRPRSRG